MPAYSVPIKVTCDAHGCGKGATEEVFAIRNDPKGKYCTKHAKERVKDLNNYYETLSKWRIEEKNES